MRMSDWSSDVCSSDLAFATGVADSMISSGSTGYDSKIWEHVKYWYDVQAWLPKNMVVVNKNAWEGLDENLQKVVLEAAAAAEENGWAKARELDRKSTRLNSSH